jgi:hypothetical protein
MVFHSHQYVEHGCMASEPTMNNQKKIYNPQGTEKSTVYQMLQVQNTQLESLTALYVDAKGRDPYQASPSGQLLLFSRQPGPAVCQYIVVHV